MLRGYRRQGSGPDAPSPVAVTVGVGVPPGSPLSGTVPFPVGLSLLHLLGLDLLTGVVAPGAARVARRAPGRHHPRDPARPGLVFVDDLAGALATALLMGIALTCGSSADVSEVRADRRPRLVRIGGVEERGDGLLAA
jgi:hypothetical protein